MEVGQKHEKWIGTLKALGEEIMGCKEQHQLQTSHLQTLALLSTSASITSLASSQFTASNEGVRKTAPSLGEVQRWRGLAEAGWVGAGGIDELELPSIEGGRQSHQQQLEEDFDDDEELHPPRRMTAEGGGEFRRSESPVDVGTPTGSIPPNYSSYVGTPASPGGGQGSSNYFPPQASTRLRPPIPSDISDQSLEPPQTPSQGRALPSPSPSSQSKSISNGGEPQHASTRNRSPSPLHEAAEPPLSPTSLKIQQRDDQDQVQQQQQKQLSRPFYVRNPTSERTLVNAPSPPSAAQQQQQQQQSTSTIRMVDPSSSNRLALSPHPQPTTRPSNDSITSPTSSQGFSPETPLDSWNGEHHHRASSPPARSGGGGGFFGFGLGSSSSSGGGGILSRGGGAGNQSASSTSSASNGSSSSNIINHLKPKKTVRVSTGGVEVIGHSFTVAEGDEDEENDAFEDGRAGAGAGAGGRLLTDWEASERREREESLKDKERERERERTREAERRERERERERELAKEREKREHQEGEKVRGIRSKLQEDARRVSCHF
ncbi:hypothetical protein BDY24DRAFT_155400 [Mrakia frigida]|uniref:uncharacterized protein n=1 Tax=Mrakia frigida TaxID=29902 RepID=UPI003FCC23D1